MEITDDYFEVTEGDCIDGDLIQSTTRETEMADGLIGRTLHECHRLNYQVFRHPDKCNLGINVSVRNAIKNIYKEVTSDSLVKEECIRLLRRGDKIEAIKRYKIFKGCGLSDAKVWVDNIERLFIY